MSVHAGKPTIINAIMYTSEAIGIGAGACSREKKSVSIIVEPPKQIPAAAARSDAIRPISEKK
jgi:hypothetical protein